VAPKAVHRYKQNQPLGRIGAKVRQSLMDAVSQLLWDRPPWQLRASDVAAHCNLRQSNFYTYFASIDEAIWARVVQVHEMHPDLRSFVQGGWGPSDFPRAQALTDAMAAFWREHRPILALARSLGEEGDPDYLQVRITPHEKFIDACVEMISQAQSAGRLSARLEPRMAAWSVFGELESLGATLHTHGAMGFSYEQSRDTAAARVFAGVTGWRAD